MQERYLNRNTLEMMAIHGVANVRGGVWCQIELPEETYRNLVKETGKMPRGPCDRCGRQTHGRAKCYAYRTIDGVLIEDRVNFPWNFETENWVYRPLKEEEKPFRSIYICI